MLPPLFTLILILFCDIIVRSYSYLELDLAPEHLPYYFSSNKDDAQLCRDSEKCPYKEYLHKNLCWGYESNCSLSNQYSKPICPDDSRGWTQTKKEQLEEFFNEGDFGYLKNIKTEFKTLCKPHKDGDSVLSCTKYTRYCRARNIWINFKTLLELKEPMRYREDVIREGQIGGFCSLDKQSLKNQGQHKSPLQSWYSELENFTELKKHPLTEKKSCDIVIDKPTFIMKLDATVSMYHHFCDFFNLYLSQHFNGSFSKDIQIVIWDTLPYSSNFGIMWKVFTKNPLISLDTFRGKKVCFKEAIFPFLPRMIYGMYYNMPLIPGCQGSGLFHAFNRHVLHRLNIKQKLIGEKLRITFLSRGTSYRRIINEDDIFKALSKIPEYSVLKVNFDRKISFMDQLKITSNTDIFIGMHGSGLTHLLFLPDWAAVFEIYHCEDENCYKDLARLRGVTYVTWEDDDKLVPEDQGHHPTLGAHAKFTNYEFDVDETLRLVKKAADKVRSHKAWKDYHKKTRDGLKEEL